MRKLLVILISFFSASIFSQHSPLFSQYVFNPQGINPANAGFYQALDVSLIHRQQWVNFEGSPKTTDFNIHSALYNKKANLGIRILDDRFGITANTYFSGIFAYRVFLKGKHYLSFGLNAGMRQTVNDWNKVKTESAGDPIFSMGTQTIMTGNFASGITFASDNYCIGVSFPNLYDTGIKGFFNTNDLQVYADYNFVIKEKFALKPSVFVKDVKGSKLTADLNLLATYNKKFTLGVGYRLEDAMVFVLKVKVNDQFEIGYAYDLTMSKLKNYSSGSHEIMLRYLFSYKVKAKRPRL